MNFTPFYIATDSLTEEQSHEVIRKSVRAGANRYEVPTGYPLDEKGKGVKIRNSKFIGVDYDNDTIFYRVGSSYGYIAIQITYDQLDAHLGLAQGAPTTTEPSHESLADKLRNTKIDLRKEDGTVDEELSRAFQEAVFECGGMWTCDEEVVQLTDSPFLYVDEGLMISNTTSTTSAYYHNQPEKPISFTYQRKLEWDVTEVPTTRPTARETIELNGITYDKTEFESVMRYLTPIEAS